MTTSGHTLLQWPASKTTTIHYSLLGFFRFVRYQPQTYVKCFIYCYLPTLLFMDAENKPCSEATWWISYQAQQIVLIWPVDCLKPDGQMRHGWFSHPLKKLLEDAWFSNQLHWFVLCYQQETLKNTVTFRLQHPLVVTVLNRKDVWALLYDSIQYISTFGTVSL